MTLAMVLSIPIPWPVGGIPSSKKVATFSAVRP
jgi:hypothetical protein